MYFVDPQTSEIIIWCLWLKFYKHLEVKLKNWGWIFAFFNLRNMILTYIKDFCEENDQHSPDFPKNKEKEIVKSLQPGSSK